MFFPPTSICFSSITVFFVPFECTKQFLPIQLFISLSGFHHVATQNPDHSTKIVMLPSSDFILKVL